MAGFALSTEVAKSGKVKGQVLAEYEGLTISVSPQKAKKAGKNRLWLQIRQNGDVKRWRVSASLSYARSADIQFEDSPGRDVADTEAP